MKILNVLLVLIFFSCQSEQGVKKDRVFVGNQKVSSKVLSKGKAIYLEYCMACHGVNGDGNGPAAKGSNPPPRNFTQGLYKFGLVEDGGLPSDEDFARIIQGGLKGTAMLKWDISDQQTYMVTQYIKTFAPQVWENKENIPGKKVTINPDPYSIARESSAIQKGKEVYHMVANCQSCHRGYATKDELNEMSQKYNDEPMTDFDEDLYLPKLQVSEYYFYDDKERTAQFVPPDFTWHNVRSGSSVEEIAMRLAAGVTGSGMPAWKGTIEDHEIWAVAYYVKSLMKLKDNKAARKLFMSRLK